MLQIVFNTVFESLFGAAPRPLTLPQFSIEQLARQSEGLHADDVASPSKLRFQDHRFNAGQARSIQNFEVGHSVLPFDAHNRL